MAGWSDIDGVGEIKAGFIPDIKFFNTYIKALDEKDQFLNMSTVSSPITKGEPFIITLAFVKDVINKYRQNCVNNKWIKETRFDNPENFPRIESGDSEYWSQDDMEELVGEYAWGIITDLNNSSHKISDFLNHKVWNGLYKLYRDVFNIVDGSDIRTSILSWEEWGVPDTGLIDNGTICPLDPNDINCVAAELESFAQDYEANAGNLQLINSGPSRRFIETSCNFDIRQAGHFRDLPEDYDPANNDYFTYKRLNFARAFSRRIHNSRNANDEAVALDVAAQGAIVLNGISEYIRTSKSGFTNVVGPIDTQFDTNFQYADFSTFPKPIIRYEFESSSIVDDRWVLEGLHGELLPYKARQSNYDLTFDDIPVPQEVTRNGQFTIFRDMRFSYTTDFTNLCDIYYKTNVPGMVYKPL